MVFESIVADILNRYLGEYVENLDKGQLKIGIWGGKERNPFLFWIFTSKKEIKSEKKNRFFASPTLRRALFTIPSQLRYHKTYDDKSLQSKVASANKLNWICVSTAIDRQ